MLQGVLDERRLIPRGRGVFAGAEIRVGRVMHTDPAQQPLAELEQHGLVDTHVGEAGVDVVGRLGPGPQAEGVLRRPLEAVVALETQLVVGRRRAELGPDDNLLLGRHARAHHRRRDRGGRGIAEVDRQAAGGAEGEARRRLGAQRRHDGEHRLAVVPGMPGRWTAADPVAVSCRGCGAGGRTRPAAPPRRRAAGRGRLSRRLLGGGRCRIPRQRHRHRDAPRPPPAGASTRPSPTQRRLLAGPG